MRGPASIAVFLVVTAVSAVVLTEIGFRIYLAARMGPSVLLYGMVEAQREVYDAAYDSRLDAGRRNLDDPESVNSALFPTELRQHYFKYRPHQVRFTEDPVSHERIDVGINSRGFRGRDFDDAKATGVTRVVTMGASSTFGIYDRDDETYPVYLERALERRCPGRAFEVINLGIPHLHSRHNLALFFAEVLPLKPDVVTFYEGYNDTAYAWDARTLADSGTSASGWRRAYVALRARLVTVAFLDFRYGATERDLSAAARRRYVEETREHLFRNLSEMQEASREAGIAFIVASQIARSTVVRVSQAGGLTMAQEAARVEELLPELPPDQARLALLFLTHYEVTQALRAWASENHVLFADVARELDRHRDVLHSFVHVTPRGNRLIARVLSRKVLEQVCPRAPVPAGG